jgi:hypothetical protein
MDKSLKELQADGAIHANLSGTEQNILRMAGNGKSPESIAKLYGCSEAEVQRIIADIRARVASATGGTMTAGAEPKPSTGDSSQARRPPESSSRPSGPPAKDRIVAYLREHGETRQSALSRLEGRAKFLCLSSLILRPPPEAPKSEPDDDAWIDAYVNREALRERIAEGREQLQALTAEVDQLEQLASVLGGVGVL